MNKKKIKELCEYKDEKFKLELDYYYDEVLEEYYVDSTLGNENLRKIRNEYRRIKNLLLDDEIKAIRLQYKLSQRDFAIALGFGEITITRYESKTVQDKAQDKIIRQSKNPIEFLKFLKQNEKKFIKVNGLSKYNSLCDYVNNLNNDINFLMNQNSKENRGYTEFNIEKLNAVIVDVKKYKTNITKTFLAKILWYIDCLNYKITNKSMTGLVYISMKYGAFPKMYDRILADKDIVIKESWINDYECYYIEKVDSKTVLTNDEQRIVKFIMEKFQNFSVKELVDYMHQEKAYKNTKLFNVISYEYSNDISINKNYMSQSLN